MKVLVDTNVIVDAMTSREPWKESAEKIFLMTANQVVDAVIERTAVKTEMDYIITRNVKDYQDGMAKAILPNDFIALMEKEE